TLRGVLLHTWERAWQYIKKAGTVILAVSILLWAAMTFPGLPEEQISGFEAERQAVMITVEDEERQEVLLEEIENRQGQAALRHSVAGKIGTVFEPVSELAGFDWRTNIALVGGFAAKEVIVSTFGTAYSLGELDPEASGALSSRLANDPTWSPVSAIALIVFVLLYAPCFVTVVTMAKESSWRWALFATSFNTALGFVLAVLVYQMGTLFLA
ncbi:MAG TPA: nucleoside recognition domain-containing protein, partial [Desulfuromonadales bacterium]|nr:nucleoside recognition domain-containing protein [Desulfuromonadales bacterium]